MHQQLPSIQHRRNGYTLLEAVVALSITVIAGTALLTSVSTSMRTSTELARTSIARDLAQLLMSEIAALPVTSDIVVTPSGSRINYSFVDHYDGWTASPPVDRYGRTLGSEEDPQVSTLSSREDFLRVDAGLMSMFSRWATVERVQQDVSNGWVAVSASTDTPFRRITVAVTYDDGQGVARELAELTRIVSEVDVTP
ncbi:hypothetical protein V22_42490 [Calycomorphotria hydatis]|uniref:Prepilin-type N-terminal cleavage/methylation domain-containing protein n=2 Tax=Calycomorphotria hydatis TaxID=2528027 RepID=A0A517TF35_9PLAN|nr:hypothetical protein V22_42490 [Calycomorphotria hydatis]